MHRKESISKAREVTTWLASAIIVTSLTLLIGGLGFMIGVLICNALTNPMYQK